MGGQWEREAPKYLLYTMIYLELDQGITSEQERELSCFQLEKAIYTFSQIVVLTNVWSANILVLGNHHYVKLLADKSVVGW